MIRAAIIWAALLAAPGLAGPAMMDKRAGWLIVGHSDTRVCAASLRAQTVSGAQAYISIIRRPGNALQLEVILPDGVRSHLPQAYAQVQIGNMRAVTLPAVQTADSYLIDLRPSPRAPHVADHLGIAENLRVALPRATEEVTADLRGFAAAEEGLAECLTWLG